MRLNIVLETHICCPLLYKYFSTVLHDVTLMAHTKHTYELSLPSFSPAVSLLSSFLHLSLSVVIWPLSPYLSVLLDLMQPRIRSVVSITLPIYPLHPSLSPHDVVVSVDGRPVSGPAEVSGVPHHGAAQAAPWIPRAVRRPSRNHLRQTAMIEIKLDSSDAGNEIGH